MNRIKLLILSGLIFISGATFAQLGDYTPDRNRNWQDRLYFGGGFGLSAGSWGTSIRLSPIVGYMITSRVSAGVGATYEFYKYNYGGIEFNDNRWGGSLFLRVNLVRQIFAYGEYSFINYSYLGNSEDRRTVDRLPVGLGLSQPLGRRSAVNFIAAYDLLYETNGAYNSPWVFSVYFSM